MRAPASPLPLLQEVSVRGIGAGGLGVGRLPDGRAVFLPRTAPGDRVMARVRKEKARWARGEVEEWLERGPGRRPPPCPLYERCGGCSLQHLEYREQLRWKANGVGEALRRIGGMVMEDPGVEPSPRELRYRNKATFTLRRLERGRVVAGFRELDSPGRVLDVGAECLLPEEGLAELWGRLREGWGEEARLLPQGRELRLTLRVGRTGGSLLLRGGRGDGAPLELLRSVPGLLGVWREVKGSAPRLLAGGETLSAEWLEEDLEVRGGAFLQVNREAAALLHRHLREVIGPVAGLRVVDAYCGAGALGVALARDGGKVVGIESGAEAVAMAREAGVEGFTVVGERVEAVLGDLLPADLVILNPPRTGLEASVASTLRGRPPRRVIYVSCDPATLARDLRGMIEVFSPRGVHCFDLFPQTGHVETVVTLRHEDG